jgi:hypothetical protein
MFVLRIIGFLVWFGSIAWLIALYAGLAPCFLTPSCFYSLSDLS